MHNLLTIRQCVNGFGYRVFVCIQASNSFNRPIDKMSVKFGFSNREFNAAGKIYGGRNRRPWISNARLERTQSQYFFKLKRKDFFGLFIVTHQQSRDERTCRPHLTLNLLTVVVPNASMWTRNTHALNGIFTLLYSHLLAPVSLSSFQNRAGFGRSSAGFNYSKTQYYPLLTLGNPPLMKGYIGKIISARPQDIEVSWFLHGHWPQLNRFVRSVISSIIFFISTLQLDWNKRYVYFDEQRRLYTSLDNKSDAAHGHVSFK